MKELYEALFNFQQEVPNIFKNSSGYNYKFADLGEINEIIKPLLKKYGLGYAQPIDGNSIKTIIFHYPTGQSIESSANIPQGVQLKGMNDFQVLGSAITYLRRYSLSSMLGLITDEDADAAGEQVKAERPKATNIIRDRDAEIKEAEADILTRAKKKINEELEKHDYTRADQKKAFILMVLEKTTVDTIDDCELLMDALDNENEE